MPPLGRQRRQLAGKARTNHASTDFTCRICATAPLHPDCRLKTQTQTQTHDKVSHNLNEKASAVAQHGLPTLLFHFLYPVHPLLQTLDYSIAPWTRFALSFSSPPPPTSTAAMASVTSLDHDMRKLRLDRYTPAAANQVRSWIEDVLGEPLAPGDLMDALKDGVALCKYDHPTLPPSSRPDISPDSSFAPELPVSSISSQICHLSRWRTSLTFCAHAKCRR